MILANLKRISLILINPILTMVFAGFVGRIGVGQVEKKKAAPEVIKQVGGSSRFDQDVWRILIWPQKAYCK